MQDLYGHRLITGLIILTLIAPLFGMFYLPHLFAAPFPEIVTINFISWVSASAIFSLIALREFVLGFLLSLFCMMIAWRIAGIYDAFVINSILSLSFLLMLSNFLYCAKQNLIQPQHFRHRISFESWQLIFIRLYIGLDLVPHFTEKLFAGPLPHSQDVQAFVHLGISNADLFVWLAGLCEFGAAIAICLGFMLRLGAIGGAFYLLIATYLGHHFSLGFIWANAGGGWEFATMWMIVILSFAFTGYKEFSLDQFLQDRFTIPPKIKNLM